MRKDLTALNFDINNRIATIKLCRPDAANAFNLTMASELARVAQECDQNPDIKVVVLTGEGRFFSAGGDLKSMAAATSSVAHEVKRMADELYRAISTFQRMRAPRGIAAAVASADG